MGEQQDEPMPDQNKGTKRTRSRANSTESSTIEDTAKSRALVRRKDMLHRESSVNPDGGEEASTISARHAATRKPQARPRLVPVENFQHYPRSLTRERLMAYNASLDSWLPYANTATASPKEKCLLFAIPLGWRYKASEAGTKAIQITDALQGVYQCTGISVTAPQEHTTPKKGHPRINGPPHAFMVWGMSVEDGKLACARYGHCVRFDSGEAFAFTIVSWDMAPPTHVTTLVGVDGLGVRSVELEDELCEALVLHVMSRAKRIELFLVGNSDYFWGKSLGEKGAELDPDWLNLLVKSLKVAMLVDEGDVSKDRGRSVQLNVYSIGAFTDVWLQEGWVDALLGDKVPIGRHGFATPIKKAHECSYCFDGDHHRRLCPLLLHPGWFHQPPAAQQSNAGAASTSAAKNDKVGKKQKHRG